MIDLTVNLSAAGAVLLVIVICVLVAARRVVKRAEAAERLDQDED
jgi:hypothetical protein